MSSASCATAEVSCLHKRKPCCKLEVGAAYALGILLEDYLQILGERCSQLSLPQWQAVWTAPRTVTTGLSCIFASSDSTLIMRALVKSKEWLRKREASQSCQSVFMSYLRLLAFNAPFYSDSQGSFTETKAGNASPQKRCWKWTCL